MNNIYVVPNINVYILNVFRKQIRIVYIGTTIRLKCN